jgi:hypothetical protein
LVGTLAHGNQDRVAAALAICQPLAPVIETDNCFVPDGCGMQDSIIVDLQDTGQIALGCVANNHLFISRMKL